MTLPIKVRQGLYDCDFTFRCQSCDQAAVGKGDHKRLQALFKDINMYAEYVPWSADSLNLVGNKLPPQYLKLLTNSLFSNSCLCSFGFHLVDGIF